MNKRLLILATTLIGVWANVSFANEVFFQCEVVKVVNPGFFGSTLVAGLPVNLTVDGAGQAMQATLGNDRYWASSQDLIKAAVQDGSRMAYLTHARTQRVTTVVVSTQGPRRGYFFGRVFVRENRYDTQRDAAHLLCR